VAIPALPRSSQAPDPAYNVERFNYSAENNTYTCPQGHPLKTNGTWHKERNYYFQQYKTPACKNCPVRPKCTKSVHNGKIIQRSEFIPAIERNRKRVKQSPALYKRRQAIVEHPYGTIKRQWGFNYIITKKGKERASADVGLMFIAYNLKRVINILGKQALMEYFKACIDELSAKIRTQIHFSCPRGTFGDFRILMAAIFENIANHTIFNRDIKIAGGF